MHSHCPHWRWMKEFLALQVLELSSLKDRKRSVLSMWLPIPLLALYCRREGCWLWAMSASQALSTLCRSGLGLLEWTSWLRNTFICMRPPIQHSGDALITLNPKAHEKPLRKFKTAVPGGDSNGFTPGYSPGNSSGFSNESEGLRKIWIITWTNLFTDMGVSVSSGVFSVQIKSNFATE